PYHSGLRCRRASTRKKTRRAVVENAWDKDFNSRGTKLNALALWAKQYQRGYEAETAQRTRALELAIQCINDGTLTLLDGPDSPLSRRIKLHHGLNAFEMNSNWIGTAQDWQCPCCGRSKFEISR